jgi:hypothetical protein
MVITRDKIVGDGLEKIWILDFTLTNAEAVAVQNIANITAAKIATMQPPWGVVVAALVSGEAQAIHAANVKGNGVGANVHFQTFPPVVPQFNALRKHDYFSL